MESTGSTSMDAQKRPRKSSTPSAKVPSGKQEKRNAATVAKVATPCVQCNTLQQTFYCDVCLSERIIFHHANRKRVHEARQKASNVVEARLNNQESAQNASESNEGNRLPNPFQDPTKRGYLINLNEKRDATARKFALEGVLEHAVREADQCRRSNTEKRQLIQRKRERIQERHRMLTKAREILCASSSEEAAKCTNDHARYEIDRLHLQSRQITQALAHTRAKLAKDTFDLFHVRPPSGSLADARSVNGAAGLHRSPSRTKRSKERYIPGAFTFDAREEGEKRNTHREKTINLNDWTINGLVLVLATDVRRFDRGSINGAIAHTVHMLQLLSSYLGIVLPFVISTSVGTLTIRPNVLWGSGTKESLYLPSTTYGILSSRESSSNTLGSMGASMISSIGASTMSTFESFVQLPSGTHLPWSRNVDVHTRSDGKQTHKTTNDVGADDKASSAAKQFYTALSMLAYDVAYLAHVQGVPVDIVGAAGSPLRLLSKAISSSKLGHCSHSTQYYKNNIPNLIFKQLDFMQLLQVHQPGGIQSAIQNKGIGVQSNAYSTGHPTNLDGSYVDARKAAASILDIRPGHDQQKGSISKSSRTQEPRHGGVSQAKGARPRAEGNMEHKKSSLAVERMPAAMPTKFAPKSHTLDFLRDRGHRAHGHTAANLMEDNAPSSSSQTKTDTPSLQKKPATSGTIMFNGIEIKGKAITKSRDKAGKTKSDIDDEDWDVL